MDGKTYNAFDFMTLFFFLTISYFLSFIGVNDNLPESIKEGRSNGFVDVFLKHACHPVEYDRAEERYKGLAEKILENSNWKDKETLELFKYFVDYCIPAVTSASIKRRLMYEILSETTTVAEEAFAFLVLENNIDRWVWLSKKKLQDNALSQEEETYLTPEDGGLPDLLYQKRVNIKDSSSRKMPAGEWTEKGMKRYNQILRCVIKSRKQKGRIDCEDAMLRIYQMDDDDDDIECFDESDNSAGRKRGQVMNRGDDEEGKKKVKVKEVVIDLFNIDDME